MKYLEAKFIINSPEDIMQTAKDLLADMAGEAGFESFEDTATGINGYVQEQLFNREMLDAGIATFPLSTVSVSYTVNKVEDQDWNEAWESEGFAPINIGNSIVIYDAKDKTENIASETTEASPILIKIDARQAFGTGTHETTQMIITVLASMDLKGKSTLDCGCGTGILSIAAAKLGATRTVGYDIDEWSVDNTRHNAALNGVEVDARLGDASVTDRLEDKFDIVMANINRNILLDDMPRFVNVMKADGTLILSGFYKEDTTLLHTQATELGLKETETKVYGDWACMVFSR